MKKDGQVSGARIVSKMVRNLTSLKSRNSRGKNPLTGDVKQAMDELENIRKFFNMAEDPELIEYAIFTEKAALMRLSYLIRKAKISEENIESLNS